MLNRSRNVDITTEPPILVMCRFSSQILNKMEKIIMQRGYGKTTQLIKKSAKSGDYIVCSRLDEANRIQFEAKDMGLDIPLPITYAEFIEKRYSGKNISGFLIDNLEMFLQHLSNVPVNAITMCP